MTDNKEIIEKLEKLQNLLEEAEELSEYAEHGCANEYSQKISATRKSIDDLNDVPSVFANMPSFPVEPEKYEELKTLTAKHDLLIKSQKIILIVSAICGLLGFIFSWHFVTYAAIIGFIVYGVRCFKCTDGETSYRTLKKECEDSMSAHKSSIKAFQDSLAVYKVEKDIGIKTAKTFAEEYKNSAAECNRLFKEGADKKIDAMSNFVAKMEEAQTYDFIPSEYYHLINAIIRSLKSGRADTYKEALNLAIQEDREARIEAARRAEEAERTRIMQEQADAERRRNMEIQRHNQQMELEQRRHNQAMLEQEQKAADDALKMAKRQSEDARQQKLADERAIRVMCQSCANVSHCSLKSRLTTTNCGGYRPR